MSDAFGGVARVTRWMTAAYAHDSYWIRESGRGRVVIRADIRNE